MATAIPLYAAPTFERAWGRLISDQSLSGQLASASTGCSRTRGIPA